MNTNTTKPIKTLSLTFTHPIHPREIPNWRGAFIEMAGWQDELFHNHKNKKTKEDNNTSVNSFHKEAKGFHFRYPLIHYRCNKGQASIFAMNEGVAALQKILATSDWNINWQGNTTALQIDDLRMNEHYLRMTNTPKIYRLHKWLALTSENYKKWQTCSGMIEKITLLEKLLGNHLVAFFRAVNWKAPEYVKVQITDIQRMDTIICHGVPLLAFNINYSCNVLLPNGIALGKSVSQGMGWQIAQRTFKNYSPDYQEQNQVTNLDNQ